MPDCHGEDSFQQKEGSFHQQIELKLQEETSEVLYLDHSILWC
jgi:hypothetical protein